MATAREIMTRNVLTVQEDTPIVKVIELLAELDVTGIPVVDNKKNLLGIITEQDVMHLFHDESSLIYLTPEDQGKTVADLMTKPAVYFDENESVFDICNCLKENHFRRVPIMSQGKLVGVISRQDIMRYVLQQMRHNVNL